MMLTPATAGAAEPEKLGSVTQVGHEPLMNRGMNAALAIHSDSLTSRIRPTPRC
jgi:hypothetical protein